MFLITITLGNSASNSAKSFEDVINSRIVRSYSEEFMSSSEERERGLQFYGGSSTGSVSSRHRIVPYFDTDKLSTNVTISEGSAFVHLPCRVKQLGERTVSVTLHQSTKYIYIYNSLFLYLFVCSVFGSL